MSHRARISFVCLKALATRQFINMIYNESFESHSISSFLQEDSRIHVPVISLEGLKMGRM